jgi:heme/copper-type cytochrome/quinol oxidase subunit 3
MNKLKFDFSNNTQHPFHLVKPSPWPITVSFAILSALTAFVLYLHNYNFAENKITILAGLYGLCSFFYSLTNWFWDIIIEATFEGKHTYKVQQGLRLGFILFIISEIMFFFSFFWAFFYSSISPSVWVGCIFPPLGIEVIDPYFWPAVNTFLLLTSGMSVTWGHKAIIATYTNIKTRKSYNARLESIKGIFITIILGVLFTGIQLFEYKHSNFAINDGIYGSAFFMITGFHGFHVLVGTIFLFVCLLRYVFYHYSREHHLGLEMAIWYWHFVDVVWIFLYVFVYLWGSY